MLRLILALLTAVIFLICMIPVQFVEFLIGKYKGQAAKDHLAQVLIRWIFKVLLAISGVKITCIGKENIPEDQAALFVANHSSIFDILVSYVQFSRPTGFVAKIETKKVPLLSSWMKLIRCLFLDRSDPREGMKMILAAIDQIKEGVSVFIFPEGTRGPDENGQLRAFKEGSMKIAQRTGCPIVPVAISNTRDVLENHFPFIRKTHVTIQFGKPFRCADLEKEDQKHSGAYTRDLVIGMLNQVS